MGFKDLRGFIQRIDRLGELRRVRGADCNLEIGAITEIAAGSPACPALLFEEPRGCLTGRVITNLLHTETRLALAIGESPEVKGIQLVRKMRQILASLASGPHPRDLEAGPVLAHRVKGKKLNLLEFPAVKWHEHDGGPYFTGGMVVTRDSDGGYINLGIYRLQIQDARTLSLHIEPGKHGDLITRKYWSRGESCPLAISLGHVPALFIAATMSVPWGMSEYQVAGLLNGGPVDVVKAPLTGLPVPASAEVVLEGEAPPPSVESRVEGPWGEATGYYASAPESKAVVRVRSISYRDEPIVHGAPPLKPFKGMKHFPVSTRTVTLWNDLENCSIPAIQGVWEHTLGMIVISLQQKYAGHARQALLIAAGSRSTAGARFITVVDDDMDPTSINEVIWAMTSRCDPERDIEVICEGWTGAIDPLVTEEQCARRDFTAGKVLVNACRPLYRRASFPAVVEVSPVYKARVLAKWPDILN